MNLILSVKLVFCIVIILIFETTMYFHIVAILKFLFYLTHKRKELGYTFKRVNKLVFSCIHFTIIYISVLQSNAGPDTS